MLEKPQFQKNFPKNSILIEGDDIYQQVINGYVSAWKDGNHLDVFGDICFNMFKIYLSYGYNVIFNYIVNIGTINNIKTRFKNQKIKFIFLLADEETLLKIDALRPVACQMSSRCIVLLNFFKSSLQQ